MPLLAALNGGCGDIEIPTPECANLSCESSLLEGSSSITGVAAFDSFFGAVIDVHAAATSMSASLRADRDAIAISVGLEAGASAEAIGAQIQARIDAATAGGLELRYAAPSCSASAEVVASAAAECQVEVEPGEVAVSCEGSCAIEGGVMASCEADATLVCTGTAPNLQCEGQCQGSCELSEPGLSCEGTCRGVCEGECSVRDSQGNCAGACEGSCEGTCELEAGGQCEGQCTGQCTYTPASGGCEADASAQCEAEAGASISCEGSCEGTASAPQVSAECQTTVEAKANAQLECTPPAIEFGWQWSAEFEASPELQIEFRAWLAGLERNLGGLLTAEARGLALRDSVSLLASAGFEAVEAAMGDLISDPEAQLVPLFTVLHCGLPDLYEAVDMLDQARVDLQGELSASAELLGSL